MDNIQLVDLPVGMNMTQIVWNAAHRIYNLRELVVLMLNSGAAFGTIMKNPFIPGAAAAVQTPHQAISFFYAARPATINLDVHPNAWRGHIIPASYRQSGSVAIVGGTGTKRSADEAGVADEDGLPAKLIPLTSQSAPNRRRSAVQPAMPPPAVLDMFDEGPVLRQPACISGFL